MMNLTSFLRSLRAVNGEILKDMADNLGIKTSYLSSIENQKAYADETFKENLYNHYQLTENQKEVFEKALQVHYATATDKKLKNGFRLVYICSPVRGNVKENIKQAKKYCKMALDMGYIPIAPHVMFEGMFDDEIPSERAMALKIGLFLVRICKEIWIFKDPTEGMIEEIKLAKKLKKPAITCYLQEEESWEE